MLSMFQLLKRQMTSPSFDAKAGQIASWIASALVLILGMFKLCRLPLTETELFFGVLLVLTVSLLGVLIGLVLPIAARATITFKPGRT